MKNHYFVIKVTNNCNISCPYCYHFKNTNQSNDKIISKDVIYNAIKILLDYNDHNAGFVWHGGEPLTIDIDYFKYAVKIQKELNKRNIKITNSVQTNGILLSDEFIDFFHENKFNIGISIDGPEDIHTKNRGISKETYNKILANVQKLNERDCRFGILTVVGKNSINRAKDILDFYIKNGIKNFAFLPCVFADETGTINYELSVTNDEYAKFLIDFFDAWIQSGVKGMNIRDYWEFFKYKKGIRRSLCKNCNTCYNTCTVAPDGKLYPCDNFNQTSENQIGTVFENLEDLVKKESVVNFGKAISSRPEECMSCKFSDVCQSGCSYHRWLNGHGTFGKKQLFCKTTMLVYNHIEKALEKSGLSK